MFALPLHVDLALHTKVVLLCIPLVAVCGNSQQGVRDTSVALQTDDEALDGSMNDLAGPPLSTDPASDRVWLAQGSLRSALRVDTAERVFAEDETFPTDDPANPEFVARLEYGPTKQRLYTLTDDMLHGRFHVYCEDASVPSAPRMIGTRYEFPDWSLSDPVLDIRLWEDPAGDDDVLVVLSSKRVSVLRFSGGAEGSFTLLGSATELIDTARPGEPWFHDGLDPSDPRHIDRLEASDLVGLKIQDEEPGRLMAYVRVQVRAYSPTPSVVRVSEIVMVCDLDQPHFETAAAHPTFDARRDDRIGYVFFNPFADLPSNHANSTDAVLSRTVHDVAPYADGQSRFLLVGCGHRRQVQRVDVTTAFDDVVRGTSGCCFPLQTEELDIAPDAGEQAGEDVLNVLPDPHDPTSRFFACTAKNLYVWDRGNVPPVVSTLHEPFDKGCGPDLVHLTIAGGPLAGDTLWTVGGRAVDHMGKVFDVTTDEAPIPVRAKYFGIFTSDGAVARGDAVYLTTFNGVEVFRPVPGGAPAGGGFHEQVVQSDCVSTEVPTGSGKCAVTEAMEPGTIPGDDFPDRLFTCDATGAFTEFRIDPSTGTPQSGRRYVPDPAVVDAVADGWTYSYPPTSLMAYSNDVAFADLGPDAADKWVLVDLTNHQIQVGEGGVQSQVVLLAYQWDPATSSWVNRAAVAAAPMPGNHLSTAIATTVQKGRHYAIVCHEIGFEVFDIERLSEPIAHMAWCPKASTRPGGAVLGLAVAGDRVFASVPAADGLPQGIEMYTWSGTTPILTPTRRYPTASFVEPSTGLAAHPGLANRGRVYLRGDGSTWDVLFGCEAYLLQYVWDPVRDSFELRGHWRSSYDGPIADCREFTFPSLPDGPRVLVLKSDDSFAIVRPVP